MIRFLWSVGWGHLEFFFGCAKLFFAHFFFVWLHGLLLLKAPPLSLSIITFVLFTTCFSDCLLVSACFFMVSLSICLGFPYSPYNRYRDTPAFQVTGIGLHDRAKLDTLPSHGFLRVLWVVSACTLPFPLSCTSHAPPASDPFDLFPCLSANFQSFVLSSIS